MSARELAFGQSGGQLEARVSGDLSTFTPDASGSCGGSGADQVYSFTLTREQVFTASLDAGSYGLPVLYLRSSCTTGELACSDAYDYGDAAGFGPMRLPAGTYFLWVDAASGTEGPYTLAATLRDVEPGETASAPLPLQFSNGEAGGLAQASGDTTGHLSETSGTCGGTGAELVYTFTTNTTLGFNLTLDDQSSYGLPVVYLRSSPTAGEETCAGAYNYGDGVSTTASQLPPGTYYLFVDSAEGTEGPFSFTAHLN